MDYVPYFKRLRDTGARVIGYVHTCWGAQNAYEMHRIGHDTPTPGCPRTQQQVVQDVLHWYAWFRDQNRIAIDGIFFDEVWDKPDFPDPPPPFPPQPRTNHLVDMYRSLHVEVKNLQPSATIVFNFGQLADRAFDGPLAPSILCIHENTFPHFAAWHSGWANQHNIPSWRFSALAYSTPYESLSNALLHANGENVGWVYFTDDGADNPWDSLPCYFMTLVTLIDQQNVRRLSSISWNNPFTWLNPFGQYVRCLVARIRRVARYNLRISV
jgi:hypothetical protein